MLKNYALLSYVNLSLCVSLSLSLSLYLMPEVASIDSCSLPFTEEYNFANNILLLITIGGLGKRASKRDEQYARSFGHLNETSCVGDEVEKSVGWLIIWLDSIFQVFFSHIFKNETLPASNRGNLRSPKLTKFHKNTYNIQWNLSTYVFVMSMGWDRVKWRFPSCLSPLFQSES